MTFAVASRTGLRTSQRNRPQHRRAQATAPRSSSPYHIVVARQPRKDRLQIARRHWQAGTPIEALRRAIISCAAVVSGGRALQFLPGQGAANRAVGKFQARQRTLDQIADRERIETGEHPQSWTATLQKQVGLRGWRRLQKRTIYSRGVLSQLGVAAWPNGPTVCRLCRRSDWRRWRPHSPGPSGTLRRRSRRCCARSARAGRTPRLPGRSWSR